MGDSILAIPVVEVEPKTARGVFGQRETRHIELPQNLKSYQELIKREFFPFAVADAIKGGAIAELLQLRN